MSVFRPMYIVDRWEDGVGFSNPVLSNEFSCNDDVPCQPPVNFLHSRHHRSMDPKVRNQFI